MIRDLYEKQEQKISNAAMETLAIVAYKQPVTKSEIGAIRGVKVDGVVSTLTEMELIMEVGRKGSHGAAYFIWHDRKVSYDLWP